MTTTLWVKNLGVPLCIKNWGHHLTHDAPSFEVLPYLQRFLQLKAIRFMSVIQLLRGHTKLRQISQLKIRSVSHLPLKLPCKLLTSMYLFWMAYEIPEDRWPTFFLTIQQSYENRLAWKINATFQTRLNLSQSNSRPQCHLDSFQWSLSKTSEWDRGQMN